MTVATMVSPQSAASLEPDPPLAPGDRMDRFEFERRWFALPEPRPRCELLEGVVHFMPTYNVRHAGPHKDMIFLLATYQLATPGTESGAPTSLRLDRPNMPEPDAFLRVLESHGGQTHNAPDGCLVGAPELVVEISSTTVRKDLMLKFGIYRRQGVREYVVWRTGDGVIDWFVRQDDRLDPIYADEDGIIRSECFPGLWIDAAALNKGDLATALTALQRGLATPEHAAFVERLATAAPSTA